jgi:hypothetical protein
LGGLVEEYRQGAEEVGDGVLGSQGQGQDMPKIRN